MIIKCRECGREISDQSKQCIHCGCPIDKANNKKNKKYLIVIMLVLFVILSCGLIMILRQTNIDKELKMIEKLFALNKTEILLDYPEAKLKYSDDIDSDLIIEGTFAGLTGDYLICVSNDGSVWRVIFEPDYEAEADENIVDKITSSLGDYQEYDSEWDYYTWETENIIFDFWIGERTYFDYKD